MIQGVKRVVFNRGRPLVKHSFIVFVFLLFIPRPSDAEEQSPELVLANQYAEDLTDGDAPAPLAVEDLWSLWDEVGPAPIVGTLERFVGSETSDHFALENARWHLAEAALRQGHLERARDGADTSGVIRSYLILGPLDNEGDRGLDHRWAPEQNPRSEIRFDDQIQGVRRPVSWREIEVPDPLGVLYFSGYFYPVDEICGFALTTISLQRSQPVVIRASASGSLSVWVNGEIALQDRAYRELHPDRYAFQTRLSAGENRLMAKVCSDSPDPALLLRVTGTDGEPLGAEFSSSSMLATKRVAQSSAHKTLDTPFRVSWQHAEKTPKNANPQTSYRAARYLYLVGGDDRNEPRVPDLASGAARKLSAKKIHIQAELLAARAAQDRNAARDRLEKLMKTEASRFQVSMGWAEMLSFGPCPGQALPVIRKLLKRWPTSIRARALKAKHMGDLGLPATGLRIVRDLAGKTQSPMLVGIGSQLAATSGQLDVQRDFVRSALSSDFSSAEFHQRIITFARQDQQKKTVSEHLDDLKMLRWHDPDDQIWVAKTLEQMGEEEQAIEHLRALQGQNPHFHEAWFSLGQIFAGQGQTQPAISALQKTLELQPQAQRARELLTHLLDEDPFEDEYMEEPEVFLARRGDGDGEHALWLLDLTLVKVYPSGLSSRFRQVAIEILDEEGASDFRSYAIGYVPDEQHVTVRRARVFRADGTIEEASGRFVQHVNDPSIRMYYDERAEVIELPRLRPGDVVEFAFRIDDVATENYMGDFFGDIVMLQGVEPRRRVSYILLHDQDRQMFVRQPELEGVRHERSCSESGTCELSWLVDNVPALRREENRPPMAELSSRIAVSTYENWDEIGRWYWGLIRDQLVPDDGLRRTVAELTQGTSNDVEKIEAIYDWVVDHTRYVALEFGVHGYKPYRVTQVVDRGFGDCKDKASLLITMLELAGIEASFVLLRTRMSGRVPPAPPSLTLFDHAIAYVPSLDLFLDGTAEQSGTQELPWMDQGVTALLVSRGGSSKVVTTPIDDPSKNPFHQKIQVTLRGQGQAPLVSLRESVKGFSAAYLRHHYQAEAHREERLESRLSRSWAGAKLLSNRFIEIENRERSVELEADFEAPSIAVAQGDRYAIELVRPRRLIRRWARRSERQTPLELRIPPHIEHEERTIELPRGAQVVHLPPSVSIRSDFGSVEITTQRSGSTIRVETRMQIARDRIEVSEYGQFRQFCQRADQAIGRHLTIRMENDG